MRVLESGHAAVWFPEGWRSPDGKLQRFFPGIGEVLRRTTCVRGTFEAWPRGRRFPRLGRIALAFGHSDRSDSLCLAGKGRSKDEQIAEALRQRVLEVGAALDAT